MTNGQLTLLLIGFALIVGVLLIVQYWLITHSVVGGLTRFLAKLFRGDHGNITGQDKKGS